MQGLDCLQHNAVFLFVITHTQALYSYEELFQPTAWVERSVAAAGCNYLETTREPISIYNRAYLFPFTMVLHELYKSNTIEISLLKELSYMHIYFKKIKNKEYDKYGYATSKLVWEKILPFVPQRLRNPHYETLTSYFNISLNQTF